MQAVGVTGVPTLTSAIAMLVLRVIKILSLCSPIELSARTPADTSVRKDFKLFLHSNVSRC